MQAQQISTSEDSILLAFSILKKHSSTPMVEEFLESVPTFEKMTALMLKGERLTFILPAFPAKSPSRQKTSGELPDMGEVLALQELNGLCHKLSSIYAPGAEVIICSDGRIFSDVVMVPDDSIDRYSEGIKGIIREFGLSYLSVLSMDDLYPGLSAGELREKLVNEFARTPQEMRHLVLHDDCYKRLFNGIHRFMLEDLAGLFPERSRTQLHKEAKLLTYELMRRSDAWSEVLNRHFKGKLRLSIHPYPLHHEKFGIKMVASSNKWATPWHNVAVKIMGRFELMQLQDVLKLNAAKRLFKEKYVFFEV